MAVSSLLSLPPLIVVILSPLLVLFHPPMMAHPPSRIFSLPRHRCAAHRRVLPRMSEADMDDHYHRSHPEHQETNNTQQHLSIQLPPNLNTPIDITTTSSLSWHTWPPSILTLYSAPNQQQLSHSPHPHAATPTHPRSQSIYTPPSPSFESHPCFFLQTSVL